MSWTPLARRSRRVFTVFTRAGAWKDFETKTHFAERATPIRLSFRILVNGTPNTSKSFGVLWYKLL